MGRQVGLRDARRGTNRKFVITPDKLFILDLEMSRVVVPGWLDIIVGPGSVKHKPAKLEVIAQ